VGGFVPAGSYRFRITPRAPAAGLGQPVVAAFTVRPRPPRGNEPAAAAWTPARFQGLQAG
jgi:hypothetical protein